MAEDWQRWKQLRTLWLHSDDDDIRVYSTTVAHNSFHSFICEDFTSCRHVLLQMDQFKNIIIMIVYIYA